MSKHCLIQLLFAALIILFSCEKLEVPNLDDDGDKEHTEAPSDADDTDDSSDEETGEYEESDQYQGWGSLENQINNGGTIARPFRAKDLAKGELGEWVVSNDVASIPDCWVEGYIVGFVKGNSMSSAKLFCKADRESNILIASDTVNIYSSDCVPIALQTGSTYLSTRNALNLKDNTGVMRRKVKILGSVSKYMGVAGLRNARDYRFTDGK